MLPVRHRRDPVQQPELRVACCVHWIHSALVTGTSLAPHLVTCTHAAVRELLLRGLFHSCSDPEWQPQDPGCPLARRLPARGLLSSSCPKTGNVRVHDLCRCKSPTQQICYERDKGAGLLTGSHGPLQVLTVAWNTRNVESGILKA